MNLPLLVSVPHAGLKIPQEIEQYCALTQEQILDDSDEGAAEVYSFKPEVAGYVTTDVARVIVDVNRAETDRSPDGVVKTRTCQDVPVYCQIPPPELQETLIERYYRPYHNQLTELAARASLGFDCLAMLTIGPSVGPDAGCQRPNICLSNADGTCPQDWFDKLIRCFEESFGIQVSVNEPFRGGHIIRTHASELPWVQVELSRAPFLSFAEKRKRVLEALSAFCDFFGNT